MTSFRCFLGFITDAVESFCVARGACTIIEGDINDFSFPASMVVSLKHFSVSDTQDRVIQPQSMNLVSVWLQDVGLGTDRTLKGHDDSFTVEKICKCFSSNG